jgi:DNA-binding PucR family transcriptional regulator
VPEYIDYLKKMLKDCGLTCGMSGAFSSIEALSTYYSQAVDALEIGMRTDGTQNLYCYEDVQAYALIRACGNSAELIKFVSPKVQQLAKQDAERGTGLLLTLKTYLDCGRSVQKTADLLHLHRNTVNYRVTKCLEELGIEQSNGKQMYRLLNSLYILEYIDRREYYT